MWHLLTASELHELTSNEVYGLVADNASNNDTMVASLETMLAGPAGSHTRVRCICHIFNLCVKVRPWMCPMRHCP